MEERDTSNDPCKVCGLPNIDHDFGELLAHLLEIPLDEGRALQKRIVDRIEEAL